MNVAAILFYGVVAYVAVGLCTALAFVAAGPERVLAAPSSFTVGARLLLLPGAAAMWPYVMIRWFRAAK
jgi:hypothetical protein